MWPLLRNRPSSFRSENREVGWKLAHDEEEALLLALDRVCNIYVKSQLPMIHKILSWGSDTRNTVSMN